MGANLACLALQAGKGSARSFAGLSDDERGHPVVGYGQALAWMKSLNGAWPVEKLTGGDSLHVANIRVRHPLNQARNGALIILCSLAGAPVRESESVHELPVPLPYVRPIQKRMNLVAIWTFGCALAKGAQLWQPFAGHEARTEAHKDVNPTAANVSPDCPYAALVRT